jgi:glycosyltransferase involved in cell wall biosynthesis
MNVTQVCNYVAPAKNQMGAERIVERLSKGLVSAGHAVSMLLHPNTKETPVMGAELVTEIPLETDIVHFHGWEPEEYENTNLPWVTTIHGYSLHQKPEKAIKNKHVVAVSRFAAEQIKAINYVWNCADPDEFVFEPNKDNYFLWMAGTDWGEGKGLISTIILAKKLGINLKIAGTGNNREIIDFIKSNCNRKIEYIGPINGTEKAEVLRKAKGLFLLSRLPDACPVTVSEALMCGTPVLASSNGSLPEIVLNGITGFICKNQAEEIRATINIDRISPEACRDYALRNFSIEKSVDNYVQIYSKIIELHQNAH